MTIPEQPGTPALTRKQMRQIRDTGATPVITSEAPPEAPEPAPAPEPASAPEPALDDHEPASAPESAPADHEPASAPEPAPDDREPDGAPAAGEPASAAPVAPLPRPATPIALPDAPVPDASVDLGVSPLTRRQARQQERIRTASVPVITPEVAAAHTAASGPSPTPDSGLQQLFGTPPSEEAAPEPAVEQSAGAAPWLAGAAAPSESDVVDTHDAEDPDAALEVFAEPDEPERPVVSPLLGAALLETEVAQVELPPSFDQLLARSTSGSGSTPNALILSQSSGASSIVAPVTATGEVLVTGTLNLPEGLGSNGHAPGVTDGKDVDSVLIDGEIPAYSSPTPIAASAAISTVKNSGEIIKPPAPEKGSRLMMTLAITAGVLALALVGVLILAFVTGAL